MSKDWVSNDLVHHVCRSINRLVCLGYDGRKERGPMDVKRLVATTMMVVSLIGLGSPVSAQVPCLDDDCPGPKPPGERHMSFFTFTDLSGDGAPEGDEPVAPYIHIVVIGESQTWVTMTDINGGATIPDVPPGRYSVRWDGQELDVDMGQFNLLILLPVRVRVTYLPMVFGDTNGLP